MGDRRIRALDEREPVDVVYTWVDGAWPGYPELLNRYSEKKQDLNPNRYRDNLDILKYSIRSLVRYAPWFRNLYLVATRPQVPAWLDTGAEGLRIVHHDEFFDPEDLPTFNSFAIVANLYKLPGVSRRFLYLEDDRLFLRETRLTDFVAPDGRTRVWLKRERTDDGAGRDDPSKSPWEAGLAFANHLLDERYGRARRGSVKHSPLFVDTDLFAEFSQQWKAEMKRTSASRFRSMYNVPAEHMYPFWLLYEGLGVRVPIWQVYRDVTYLGVENWMFMDVFGLANILLRRPKWYSLNDNFDENPNPRVVQLVKRFLERTYPEPSRFERS